MAWATMITAGENPVDSVMVQAAARWLGQGDHRATATGHRASGGERNGGSHYAFADGSARFLRYGAAFSPKNLWAVANEFRHVPLPEL